MGIFLSRRQRALAIGTVRAVKREGLPYLAADICLMVQLTEAGLKMIASANVPESQKYPHDLLTWTYDGLGHDHASMNSYQQQTGYKWTPAGYGRNMNQTTMDSPDGWGTPEELMSFEGSTKKFLHRLKQFDWRDMEPWLAAQRVQGSAFSDGSNYRNNHKRAMRMRRLLWPWVKAAPAKKKPTPPTPKPKRIHKKHAAGKSVTITVRPGNTLSGLAENWHTTIEKLILLNKQRYPSIAHDPGDIRVGWKLRVQ